MKTPLSPSQFLESGRVFPYGAVCLDLMDMPTSVPIGPTAQQTPPPVQGVAYSLCEVCNLQLTSTAQAQLHYNGRSHLRRVRQLQAGETGGQATAGDQSRGLPQVVGLGSQAAGLTPGPVLGSGLGPLPSTATAPHSSTTGSGCASVSGALPGLVARGGSSVMMKPFLSFPVETSPVGLFPNFNTMDPVQKAVINHTFGVTMVPKKKQVISCNICQLRFNSDSQAEAHYKGSRHAKKVKAQVNKAKTKMSITGDTNGSSSSPTGPALPVSSANSSTSQQTDLLLSLDDSCSPLKPSTSSSSLSSSSSPRASRAGSEPPPSSPPSAFPAPGISTSSSKASPPAPATSSPASITFLLGSLLPPHPSCQSKTLTHPPPPSPPPPPPSSPPPQSSHAAPLSIESEEEKAKKLLYCSLCKVAVNSLSQLEAHNTGSKHKTMLEARSGAGPIKAYPRPGTKLKNQTSSGPLKGSGLQNKTFHCQICDVHVNSEIQLKQHISSRRHKDRVAGKPSKPKYSPYNKLQRSTLTTKLALQKDLVKPSISPSFLSSPFCPTSSFASSISLPPSSLTSSPLLPSSSLTSSPLLPPSSLTSSPSSLSPSISLHPHPTSSLFPPSFLRPAPGPIRATQGSILFSPY